MRLGWVHINEGNAVEGMCLIREALKIARKTSDAVEIAGASYGLGETHIDFPPNTPKPHPHTKRLRRYTVYSEKGQAKRTPYTVLEKLSSDYAAASSMYGEARTTYLHIREEKGTANAKCGLGDVYRMRSEYDKAPSLYKEATRACSGIDDTLGEADAMSSLGDVGRNTPLRQHYTNRPRDQFSGWQPNRSGQVHALLWGGLPSEIKYSGAVFQFEAALEIYSLLGDDMGRANCIRSLGEVYRLQSKCTEADSQVPGSAGCLYSHEE
ncbi:hypothetical protein FRC04_011651 [Tulasnella sp. 424]|nr:hypothetical protein FRC04_011651 [Tulasnella sp. 424]